MEKTKEQKQASKNRFLAQEDKATRLLINADSLYDYIEGLRYAYSFTLRYGYNLKDFVLEGGQIDRLEKCLKAGILKEWNDTYWFDREKAASLQAYLIEHQTK